ncbi:MAG: MFS transporter [Dehalococcoidia bacterium]|nr:MFS transporter [Dehalococcoidia bacterium]
MIAGSGAVGNFLTAGISVWSFGIFIAPLREELGWSTAVIALGFSIRSFEQGLMAPVTGLMVDRFGPRKMAVTGAIVLAIGILMFSQAHSKGMYYGASVVMALGQSVGSFVAYSAALMRWFRRYRGRAMGVLNAGNGAGYALVLPLSWLITAVGWRETLVISAIVLLVVTVPIALLLRDDPTELGLGPDGVSLTAQEIAVPVAASGMSVHDAVRTPMFYLLALAGALNGAAILGWIVHQIPHLKAEGFSTGEAASVGVAYAVCQIAFRPASGFLGDRIGRKRLFVIAFALQGVGMVVFALISSERVWLLPVYFMTFAFGQAAWVVMQLAVVADYFGPRRVATINGLIGAAQMPAGVLSPVLAGLYFDRTGSYVPVFIVFGVLAMVAAFAVSLIRRPPWPDGLGGARTAEEFALPAH